MTTIAASSIASVQVVARAPRVSARRAAFNGVSVRPRAVVRPAAASSSARSPSASLFNFNKRAKKDDDDELKTQRMPFAFNAALAAMMAGSVMVTDAISPEWAEAGRSGGRMGGSSFRAPSRGGGGGGGGMRSQSRQAPAMRAGGGGMGYAAPSIFFSPFGFSPFGYGMGGFGMGGMSFIFNAIIFFWIVNFVLSFVSSIQNSQQGPGDDKKDDDSDNFRGR
eukprot:CAMPEP_0197576654 /NCGR_PEP_ID=MMETSP1326-20131121/1598_1 /TAXON_ID=1155430 /ORGANISM="Genus nov. species nov., Strain RCC2288" /LENGTH=221 /DNA_ID=CAMNT_0043139609 /DNA_START=59 /DNA_END=724 /DNA_ORIENTATION=-